MYYTFNLNENVIKQNCFKENKKKQQQPNKIHAMSNDCDERLIGNNHTTKKKGQVNLC